MITPDAETLRPPALALIRAYLAEDYWTAGVILSEYGTPEGPARWLAATTGGQAANLILEACGGDRRKALTLADHWLTAAVQQAAA